MIDRPRRARERLLPLGAQGKPSRGGRRREKETKKGGYFNTKLRMIPIPPLAYTHAIIESGLNATMMDFRMVRGIVIVRRNRGKKS